MERVVRVVYEVVVFEFACAFILARRACSPPSLGSNLLQRPRRTTVGRCPSPARRFTLSTTGGCRSGTVAARRSSTAHRVSATASRARWRHRRMHDTLYQLAETVSSLYQPGGRSTEWRCLLQRGASDSTPECRRLFLVSAGRANPR